MSLVKWRKEEDLFPSLTSFFDDVWGNGFYNSLAKGTIVPAVNILEEDDEFLVEVAAPGLKKEDFKVTLDKDILTISAEHKEEKEKKTKRVNLREFNFTSFERSFAVPDVITTDKIEANYKDGVLHIALPKKVGAKISQAKTIAIK